MSKKSPGLKPFNPNGKHGKKEVEAVNRMKERRKNLTHGSFGLRRFISYEDELSVQVHLDKGDNDE